MHFLLRYVPLLLVLPACGPIGECQNPNTYRVLAWNDGSVYERRDARIKCIVWGACAADGTDCRCERYRLYAGDFLVEFPQAEVGSHITLDGGATLTITKREEHPTVCANGNYYVDYSGTFSGTIGSRHFSSGAFYAIETK
jgi:hypothetical protein